MYKKLISENVQLTQDEILEILEDDRFSFENQEKIYNGTVKLGLKHLIIRGLDPEEHGAMIWIAVKKACENYDSSRGASFTTYLIWKLKSELGGYFSKLQTKSNRLDVAISLDQEININDGAGTWHDIIADANANYNYNDNSDLYEAIEKKLRDRERFVILGILAGNTQREIAKDLNITHQGVSLIKERCIIKLRKYYQDVFDAPVPK